MEMLDEKALGGDKLTNILNTDDFVIKDSRVSVAVSPCQSVLVPAFRLHADAETGAE